MDNTSYIALSREAALWRQMGVVANNMANANTPGFKSEQMMFTSYLAKTKSDQSPFGRKLAFAQDFGVLHDTREGPLTQTGDSLDIAIHGQGYYTVDTPGGQRYTRAGHFRLDETGMVVTTAGYPVLQQNGNPIVLAPGEKSITVAGDGTISTENGQIGKLQVSNFANEQLLQPMGDGTYQTDQSPVTVQRPNLVQGMLEESNVQPVVEMTNMLNIMRSYEGVMNMIQSEHDRQMKAIDTLSGAQAQA
jgi:flagellar basal-body rod protein FlgF